MRILCFLLLVPTLLLADVEVQADKKQVSLGEAVHLRISHTTEKILLEDGAFTPPGDEIPLYEVQITKKQDSVVEADIRFFRSGEHSLLVPYAAQGKQEFYEIVVNVKAEVTDNDQFLDIAGPLLFAGSIFWTVVLLLLAVLLLSGLGYFAFRFFTRKKQILDAEITPLAPSRDNKHEKHLTALIAQPEMDVKEFLFALTFYLKEKAGESGTDFLSKTDVQLEHYFIQKYQLSPAIMRDAGGFDSLRKYNESSGRISAAEANKIVAFWKGVLG